MLDFSARAAPQTRPSGSNSGAPLRRQEIKHPQAERCRRFLCYARAHEPFDQAINASSGQFRDGAVWIGVAYSSAGNGAPDSIKVQALLRYIRFVVSAQQSTERFLCGSSRIVDIRQVINDVQKEPNLEARIAESDKPF